MDIREIYKGIDEKFLSDFSLISSQINHHVKKGEVREEIIKDFLEEHLPKKYSISSGEIIDSKKHVSHQCDIVIYDESNCPLILSGNNFNIFPSEPVLATIEVKSCLDKDELIDCCEKTKKIKNLLRENGYIASIVIAFTTGYSTEGIHKLSKELSKINASYELHELIDLIFVIDSGVIMLWNYQGVCAIPKNLEERIMQGFWDLAIPRSLYFFVQLLDLLSNQISMPPCYERYMGGGEIGTCCRYDLQ